MLLLLAGTGYVALPQILHHREPVVNLGIPAPRWRRLLVPIDAVLSFREDDLPCAEQIAGLCADGGLRRATVLLTEASPGGPAPFTAAAGAGVGDAAAAERALRGVENASVVRGRLTADAVAEAVARMPQPCRCVVSGNEGFNAAARSFLSRVIDAERVTVLAA